jgi:hypothetical protein
VKRALAITAGILAAIILAGFLAGFVSVQSWGADVAIGTDTSYCGWYLPHADFYCQHAN